MKHKNGLIAISYLITSLGILVVIGWVFNILTLKAVLPGFTTMKVNAALCFIALGVAFNLTLKEKGRSIYLILAGFAFLVCLLSFLQDILNANFGIDELLIADNGNFLKNNFHPGRMAPTTAVSFFLIAFSLFILNNKRWNIFGQYVLHFVSLITFIAIVGYFFSVPTLYKLAYLPSMAVHTAIALFVFSIAISMVNPYLGITGLFTGDRIGNQMARRLFPKMIIALFILAFLRIEAHRYQLVGVELGIILFALSFSFVGLILIWDTATLLNKIDHKRENAENEIRLNNENLEKTVIERTADLKRSLEAQGKLNNELHEKIELVKQQDQTIEKIQEFKFLADSIPQIIWTTKADGTVDYYNQYWFTYSGLTLQETTDQGWIGVMHPDDLEKCVAAWKESFTTGTSFESEYRLKRGHDGVYKWHLGRAQPMKNEDGQIIKWFGSGIDIDEYKKAIELQKRIALFEDFNRIVAHNLRGPAGSIQMILAMMSESESDTEKSELFVMLKQSSATLNETLNDLMQVLEVRNNNNLPYDDCNLKEIVAGVEAMLTGQIISKHAKIHTDFEVLSMKFPKIYLESIFYNMISNSLKYCKSDIPPEIRIASRFANDKVILTFSDNGLGIDLIMHGDHIFKLNKIFHRGLIVKELAFL
ncbi:PAS domain-containing protein [Mucilaginibacter sp. 10B2]|uniref:PAS domain-containing protein n=1 Tax=Mucilaginibacter sp. 10B2 TaxID=3048574 RepID=UPI002B22686D|nr:PAS domain-containing protein [Mucilaginibacter sp. 10B2]MEB0280859.1 PAS domain-containing protein [Mucilaginibacter sp. 10B2]